MYPALLKLRRNAYAHASTTTYGNLGKVRLLASPAGSSIVAYEC